MQISRSQVRAVETLHKGLTQAMSKHYAEYVGKVVDADIAFVDITTYGEFIVSLNNPGCSYTFNLHPLEGPAIFDYSLHVAYGLLSYALDDKAVGSVAVDERPTIDKVPEERAAMAKIVLWDLADLEAVWESLEKIQVTDATIQTDPNEMKIVELGHNVLLVALEVNGPDFSGLVNLCYPDCTLESVLPKLAEMGSEQS